jgi:hypothetical protein
MGLLTLHASLVLGQLPTARISGVVRDSTGAVLPGATLTATNREIGLSRTAQAGADGRFQFAALPVGTYDITAEVTAFKTEVQQGLTLAVGQEAVLHFGMVRRHRQGQGYGQRYSSSSRDDQWNFRRPCER